MDSSGELSTAWVRLNVGGRVFHTMYSTLTAAPSSLLSRWATTSFADLPRNEDGMPFIDRDPDTFRLVLNYLRGYQLDVSPEESAALFEDAAYYQLDGLLCVLGGDAAGASKFLKGPGVSLDGTTFSASSLVSHVILSNNEQYISSGSCSVMFHIEKLSTTDQVGIAVVSSEADTHNQDLLGRRGTVCYCSNGQVIDHFLETVSVTHCVKVTEGDYVTVHIEFASERARVSFFQGTDKLVHETAVLHQALCICVLVQGTASVQVCPQST